MEILQKNNIVKQRDEELESALSNAQQPLISSVDQISDLLTETATKTLALPEVTESRDEEFSYENENPVVAKDSYSTDFFRSLQGSENESFSEDEGIKKAYRDLARKYHPDNYHDNPLADLAQEKMKEINAKMGTNIQAVLEDVVNPTNVGAIFRCAAALGMDAVLLTPACSDPLYRRAIRVSMGTVFQVPWTYLDGSGILRQERLRSMGFKTAAMALRDDSLSIDDPRLRAEEKLAVVLGTEGDGLACDTIRACDYTVRIPMYHGVDSLNVAAA